MGTKTPIEFDIDRYLRNSKRLDLTGIDWARIPDHPLTDGDVMCMHYMMDIETHTVIYLRDLLATRAAHDPQITAFLSCWVYEELWHGEAFSEFLRAYGIEVPAEPKLPDGSTPMPTRVNRVRRFRERLGVGHQLSLLPTMLGSLLTRDFIAIHMTWGAINELSTLTGYYQLTRRSDHPVLHQMLKRVIQDERRHFAFYRAQAKARLTVHPKARRLVRLALTSLWTPVGAGAKSEEEVDALVLYLFGDSPEGRRAAREIDATIAELPGLEQLALAEDYLDSALERARSRPGWAGVAGMPERRLELYAVNAHEQTPLNLTA
jgi:rubrerythrin